MSYTAGVDIGSTYTKSIVVNGDGVIVGSAINPTGFRLTEIAATTLDEAARAAGVTRDDLAYVAATGFGRHQATVSDVQVTDLTASARGVHHLFPNTKTILDVGGQTMKASRVDEAAKVKSFRLNDKCAAGTGAFLEKTARYMGYSTAEIGPLVDTSKASVPISGVCAVFAESEVINHVSQGAAPGDIMHGAMASLIEKSVRLMKR
ncbi:MAG: acyl-CoA dehydratase activase, partial [Gemmatimonadales bacterium]